MKVLLELVLIMKIFIIIRVFLILIENIRVEIMVNNEIRIEILYLCYGIFCYYECSIFSICKFVYLSCE